MKARARRVAAILYVLALAVGCAASSAGSDPVGLVGKPAPDFSLRDTAGRPVSLEYYRGGRHVVLVFYIGHT